VKGRLKIDNLTISFEDFNQNFVFHLQVLKSLNERLSDSLEKNVKSNFERHIQKDFANKTEIHLQSIEWVQIDKAQTVDKYTPFESPMANLVYDEILMPLYHVKFIREMGLVFLIVEFENYLKENLNLVFTKEPNMLASSKKTITLEELVKSKDLDSVRKKLVEKEINEIINQDIVDINEYFIKKIGIDLSEQIPWNDFKERFYRRNLIIHNSGLPNNIYREKTGYSQETKHLDISKEYLEESITLFSAVSLNLTASMMSKFEK
jgi:hypothetical protein